ncbi:MAG: phosphoesterase [Desulfobacteraceae bacterium]|nr:MAG: phosphoesterase [Desulfobacteraceae bacterium]
MQKKESVLCIRRNDLPDTWVEKKSIIPMDLDSFCTVGQSAGFQFMDRGRVEADPSLKQIIPYIMFQTPDGLTAVYKRAGSETRLHDLWSLGIGGHINPEDHNGPQDDFKSILMAGMERELSEEVLKRPDDCAMTFLGMISEDMTDVGQVHMGAVFKISTSTPEGVVPGEELTDFQWINPDRLSEMNFELWSQMVLDLIA